ncbi:hypothetical protein V6N12_002121 [Hibiscus sabdariffa]|uniref:Uncharacterized protein n=1 Tax=Hibiscus sabdariffa TaxID=183260 RepID=A0ABR2B1Q7_9ROSI
MPVCPCAVRLAGGGWDSGVFGAAVWQPHGGIGQFRWLHREGLVQFRWQNRGGPVQSRWQHHGGPVQFRWQHWGGPVQFRWQHRGGSCWPCCAAGPIGGAGECWSGLARMPPGAWLWPPLGRCPPLQHSCATCSPHSDVGLPRALLAWPADWACSTDVVGIMGAGMMVWCASSGTPMPLLATMLVTMLVTALVVGSALSRPVTVAGAVIGCLAWHPSLFSWCASKLTGAVFLSIACPGVAHFPWPINLVVVEAFFAEGSMDRPLRLGYVFGSTWGLLVVAKGAPWSVLGSLGVRDPGARAGAFSCTYGCFSRGRLVAAGSISSWPGGAGRSRGRLPGFATSALLGLGIFAPRVRVVPMAFDGCLCGGCSLVGYLALPSELFADWLILHRVVLSARPRESLISCFTSYLLRASFVDSALDPPAQVTDATTQSDPSAQSVPAVPTPVVPEVRTDPAAPEVATPVVRAGSVASSVAAPGVRADSAAPLTAAPMVRKGLTAPASAAPVVRKSPTAPATAAPVVRKSPAPTVRKGPAVPATAAPVVRKGPTVPTTAAPAVRKDSAAPNVAAPVVRTHQPAADTPPTPSVPLETDVMVEDVLDEDTPGQDVSNLVDGSFPDDAPYDPMVHAETSDMLEEALEISRDCVMLADLTGVIQADGEDLVNEVIPEAADSIIREVAASILGVDAPPDAPDAPVALVQKGPSLSASPSKSGLSKSASAGLRRAAMPAVPEHQEFDEWCAARSHTPPANVAGHPAEARASSIPPPRPHKRQASSSDPSRAKRSRASSSSSTRIPSTSKAGMSSVNNSPAETARQSRREK